jgi:hypothetical protein
VAAESSATDFQTFLLSLVSSAMLHLGEVPDPDTNERKVNLAMAQQTIDILTMLREKTSGNLTAEEDSLFGRLLYDMRLRFVNCTQSSDKSQ